MGRSRLVIVVVVVVVVVITHSSNSQMSALALDRNLARRLMGWGRGGGPCGSSGFQDTITLLEDLVAGRARYGLEDPPPLPPRGAVR